MAIATTGEEEHLMQEGRIIYPVPPTGSSELDGLAKYFSFKSESRIAEAVYGGKPLTQLFDRAELTADSKPGMAWLVLTPPASGCLEPLSIHMSFRQLVVESSRTVGSEPLPTWADLTTQQRLEICQNELSRWSLILKSPTPQAAWANSTSSRPPICLDLAPTVFSGSKDTLDGIVEPLAVNRWLSDIVVRPPNPRVPVDQAAW
ncbi:MAG: hypothetical protein AAF628_26885 [Planctomycetota bacterium]